MQTNIEKRVLEFDPTIYQILKKLRVKTSSIDELGFTQNDFISILRTTAWMVIKQNENVDRVFVCKCLWNKARDIMRFRRRKKNRLYRYSYKDSFQVINKEPEGTYDPTIQINLSLDLPRVLGGLKPKDVELLSTYLDSDRKSAAEYLGISINTLDRHLKRIKTRIKKKYPELMGSL